MSANRSGRRLWLAGAIFLGLAAAGCGASATSTTTTQSTASRSQPAAARVPALHVRILSPRSGAATGTVVTVRVSVSQAGQSRKPRLSYALDRHSLRSHGGRVVLRGLTAGRHHLVVTVPGSPAARATAVFHVVPPRPVSPAAATATAPQPTVTTTTAPPPQTSTSPPPATTTTTAPAATPPPATGGIPQNGGGDGDGDNHGAPSDGDGNI